MSVKFPASTGQKTKPGSTPFDKITQLEEQEANRVKQELDAMSQEHIEVEKAVEEKTQQAEEELKDQAREELKKHKDTEIAQILNKAQSNAEKRREDLEVTYKQHEKEATEKLVSTMTNADSSLLT